jgi:HNH endonuclease
MENLFSPEAEEEVFGTIMKLIARLSETKEDVQKILSDLHDADWDTMLAHNLYYDQEAHNDYFNDWYCGACHENFPRSQMSKIQGWNPHFYYCPACQEEIKRQHAYTCAVCQLSYVSMKTLSGNKTLLCPSCKDEGQVVKSNLGRAIAYRHPATLTLPEWIATLRYFNWTCTYCRERKYELLEHFIPLKHDGGGTTAENCIPACYACNVRKGDVHPAKLGSIFQPENLSLIQEYLAGQGTKPDSAETWKAS